MYKYASQRRKFASLENTELAFNELLKYSKYEWTKSRGSFGNEITGNVEDVSSDLPPISFQINPINGDTFKVVLNPSRSELGFMDGHSESKTMLLTIGDRRSVAKIDSEVFKFFIPMGMRYASQRRKLATAGFALDTLNKYSKYEWTTHKQQDFTGRKITGNVEDVSSDMPSIPFIITSSGVGGNDGSYVVTLNPSRSELGFMDGHSESKTMLLTIGDRRSVAEIDSEVFKFFIPMDMRYASQRRRRFFI